MRGRPTRIVLDELCLNFVFRRLIDRFVDDMIYQSCCSEGSRVFIVFFLNVFALRAWLILFEHRGHEFGSGAGGSSLVLVVHLLQLDPTVVTLADGVVVCMRWWMAQFHLSMMGLPLRLHGDGRGVLLPVVARSGSPRLLVVVVVVVWHRGMAMRSSTICEQKTQFKVMRICLFNH